MFSSPEPTRELVLCLSQHAERLLQQRVAALTDNVGKAIRIALDTSDSFFCNPVSVFRFWSWDLCLQDEHPVVQFLHEFVQDLPADEYWLIRIVADDNIVEEAGQKARFNLYGIEVIQAPRFIF